MAWSSLGRSTPRARRALRFSISTLLVACALGFGSSARAQGRDLLTPLGGKGQIAIDQISGIRLAGGGDGKGGVSLSYYGPLGFSTTRVSTAVPNVPNGNFVAHQTTFWFAPSADFFVIDHLSIGGLIAISSTSGSVDQPDPRNPNVTVNTATPTFTDLTLMPRVGYLFPITDRFGIWPRLGVGYVSRAASDPDPANGKTSFQGLAIDLDVGFVFRVTESFFLKAAPQMAFIPGGSFSSSQGGVTVSQATSVFQFSGVTGIGVFFDL